MRAGLELSAGRPRLLIDGREHLPLLYATSVLDEKHIRSFTGLGIELVSFSCTADHHLYGLAAPVWTGPETFDYDEVDRRIALVLKARPEALILPKILLSSPPWWDEAHPEDLVVWDDGTTRKPLLHGAMKTTAPSLGSERWRAAMRANVRRFVEHLENGPHEDKIVGYMVNSENSEEWFHWGTMEGYLFDYNPAVLERFRAWLRRKYGSDAALARAWGKDIAIGTATIPAAERRRAKDDMGFRATRDYQDVVDHALFFGDLTAETIIELAREVKDATGGRKLAGTFYGYLLELAYHPDAIQNGGHIGLGRVLGEPAIDFLASPGSYARRLPASGYSMSMVPTASVAAAGKVFFHENDLRTHVLFDDAGYGRCDTAAESVAMQFREFADALTRGHGMWWFDMTAGWYDDPALRGCVKRIVDITARLGRVERRSAAEIGVVIDARSLLSASLPPAHVVQLIAGTCLELSRAGAPFETMLLEDIGRLPEIKFYVFPTSFAADAAARRDLHARLEARGAHALWLFASGLIDGSIDIAHASALTGIELALPEAARFLETVAQDDGRRRVFGSPHWHTRAPISVDPKAEVLGRNLRTGDPEFVAKTIGRFRSIFSASPAPSGAILRRLLAEAGVHIYLDTDDAVYASSAVLAVHARDAGRKRIRVPGTTTLFDLLNEVEIQAPGGKATVYLEKGGTALFYRGSAAAWRRL